MPSDKEYKSEKTTQYQATVNIQERITYGPAMNAYGSVSDAARPKDSARQVIDVTLSSNDLASLQSKIAAHVELAE